MQDNMEYKLPSDSYKDWARNEARDFVPTDRQRLVIESVRRATVDESLFYTKDVYAFCVKELNPSTEILCVNAEKVEGGEFGMDLYYARRYLDAQKHFAAVDAAHARLKPQAGMVLGTLVLQDFKRNTGAKIVAVEGYEFRVQMKRGAHAYDFVCPALTIRYAMDRAHERGHRKDNFEQFCDALQRPKANAAKTPEDDATLSLAF